MLFLERKSVSDSYIDCLVAKFLGLAGCVGFTAMMHRYWPVPILASAMYIPRFSTAIRNPLMIMAALSGFVYYRDFERLFLERAQTKVDDWMKCQDADSNVALQQRLMVLSRHARSTNSGSPATEYSHRSNSKSNNSNGRDNGNSYCHNLNQWYEFRDLYKYRHFPDEFWGLLFRQIATGIDSSYFTFDWSFCQAMWDYVPIPLMKQMATRRDPFTIEQLTFDNIWSPAIEETLFTFVMLRAMMMVLPPVVAHLTTALVAVCADRDTATLGSGALITDMDLCAILYFRRLASQIIYQATGLLPISVLFNMQLKI